MKISNYVWTIHRGCASPTSIILSPVRRTLLKINQEKSETNQPKPTNPIHDPQCINIAIVQITVSLSM